MKRICAAILSIGLSCCLAGCGCRCSCNCGNQAAAVTTAAVPAVAETVPETTEAIIPQPAPITTTPAVTETVPKATAAITQPAPITTEDGQELEAKDYLVEKLNSFLQSEQLQSMRDAYLKAPGREKSSFKVIDVFELKLDHYGNDDITLHLLVGKADCKYINPKEPTIVYDIVLFATDYDTGIFYDMFSIPDDWQNGTSKENGIFSAAKGGRYNDKAYKIGDPIFLDSETHVPMSPEDLAYINEQILDIR